MIFRPITILHAVAADVTAPQLDDIRQVIEGLSLRGDVRQILVAPAGGELLTAARRHVPVWPSAVHGNVSVGFVALLTECFADDWDVVHAHGDHALRFALVARALSGGRAPVVSERLDATPIGRPSTWQRADLVLVRSGEARDALIAKGLDRRRVEVLQWPAADGPAALRACYAALTARGR